MEGKINIIEGNIQEVHRKLRDISEELYKGIKNTAIGELLNRLEEISTDIDDLTSTLSNTEDTCNEILEELKNS